MKQCERCKTAKKELLLNLLTLTSRTDYNLLCDDCYNGELE